MFFLNITIKMGLIVKNAVKKAAGKMRIAGDFIKALDKHVEGIIKSAAERAKSNGRATLRPADL